jgi:iron(III) transport system substrate-binding protein
VPASLIAAAKKEGKLVFYTVEPDAENNAIAQAFTAKYGIQVEILRLITGPMLERFAGEERAGSANADILQVVDNNVWTDDASWFVNLDKHPVPGWKDYPAVAKHVTCADLMYSVGGITYNTDLVDKAHVPTTYKDLLKPYWKGKLLLTDPRTSPAYMGWAAAVEKKYGISYLKDLAKQDPVLVASASPGAQQVAAGGYYANVMAHLSNSTDLRTSGAPLGFDVMSDVPTGLPTCAGIPADAPHPNAARLFMSWRLTVESQDAACAVVELGSPLVGAKKCVTLPKGWKPTDLAVMDNKTQQDQILSALGIQ